MSAAGHLQVYLNDHHAGSMAGVELARRIAKQNADNEYGREVAGIAKQIDEDRERLIRIMDDLRVRRKRIRSGAAWVGEKLGRLKPNRRLFGYSPLSRLLELEVLLMGITGKLSLWRSLDRLDGLPIERAELKELIARAESQRDRVERLRLMAASEAFRGD